MALDPRSDLMQARVERTGRRIAQARRAARLERAHVAEACGHQEAWLGRIERGENSINVHDLVTVAKLLRQPLEFFLDPSLDLVTPSRPRSWADWRAMAPGDPDWAKRHWDLDQIFAPASSSEGGGAHGDDRGGESDLGATGRRAGWRSVGRTSAAREMAVRN